MPRATTITLLLATLLAAPALGQEAREGMKGHGDMPAGHDGMEMRMDMHGAMPGMLTGHAERLGLTEAQIERLAALDQRLEAEKERHHAEMHSIHQAAMEVLTPEQRERMHETMRAMHAGDGEGHGIMRHRKDHGESATDDEAGDDEDHGPDHPGT